MNIEDEHAAHKESTPAQADQYDETLDLAIIEAMRFVKAAKSLRAARKGNHPNGEAFRGDEPVQLGKLNASMKRKALDLRYILADLRR
jgi:hypothetical protein